MAETDLPYSFESSVTSPEDTTRDPDQNNLPLLVKHLNDVKELISKHNTFDVIDPTSKYTIDEQMIGHRFFVAQLRLFEADLTSKIEELSSGR